MDSIVTSSGQARSTQVRMIISAKTWLESSAVMQLHKTAELPGMCCAVGMPDLHPGKGQPIGAAFITRDVVYPHLVGSDIGCGMGLWQLDIGSKRPRIDKWEKKLVGLDDAWNGDVQHWMQQRGFDAEHTAASNNKLGSIGGGNHFAEIQMLKQIFDEQLYRQSGFADQAIVLLVHSGSRGLGQQILRQHVQQHGANGLTSDVAGQQLYLNQHGQALKWAALNRELIAQRFCQCLGVDSEKMLDILHNTVLQLPKTQAKAMGLEGDDNYWIHRKGASPSDRGLVMIPGSRGSLSYLVKPRPEGQIASAYSLAHGAGRKWKRSDVRGRLEQRYKVKQLQTTAIGSRVICKPRDLLYEEAPQAYKNIDQVIDDLVQHQCVDIVASFKPLISYKTRRQS